MSRVAIKLIAVFVLALFVSGSECAVFCSTKACQTKVPPCHKQKQVSRTCMPEAAAVPSQTAPVGPEFAGLVPAAVTPALEPIRPVQDIADSSPPPRRDLLSSTVLRV